MRKQTFQLAASLCVAAFFIGCKPNGPAPQTGNPSAPNASTTAGADRYFHLKGTIGDLPVTVHLVGDPTKIGQGALLKGYYSYEKSTEPISLFAVEGNMDGMTFEESYQGAEPNQIKGKLTADGHFAGTWSDAAGKRQLPVSWSPATGGVALTSQLMADSSDAKPGVKDSPRAYFEQGWLLPDAATEAGLRSFLENEIRLGMAGDSLGRLAKSPAEAFAMGKQQYFDGEKEMFKDWTPTDSTFGEMDMRHEEMASMVVFFNEANLLTLGFWNYSFTGGAHGMYGTAVRSYDLAAKKRIALADVLKPGYEKKMAAALARSARRKFGLRAADALMSVLFENEIKPNENFGLTSKGIFFNYVPYEIASYAQGEIQIFVPFEEIRDLLKTPR